MTQPALEEDRFVAASQPYLGQWQRLISTTNWEKGAIIGTWRDALAQGGAAAAEYSDEAWARLAGGVSPQHVGRLRRVHRRFVDVRESYDGLYWSHFFAALDWNDAEMWLEGAVQNRWSVSEMRRARWETLGAAESTKPRDEDVVAASFDEDVSPEDAGADADLSGELAVVRDLEGKGRDDESKEHDEVSSGSASPSRAERKNKKGAGDAPTAEGDRSADPFGPFEKLPALPDDLADAVEGLKLAIVRHRVTKWDQASPRDVAAWLDALKSLALAPPEA